MATTAAERRSHPSPSPLAQTHRRLAFVLEPWERRLPVPPPGPSSGTPDEEKGGFPPPFPGTPKLLGEVHPSRKGKIDLRVLEEPGLRGEGGGGSSLPTFLATWNFRDTQRLLNPKKKHSCKSGSAKVVRPKSPPPLTKEGRKGEPAARGGPRPPGEVFGVHSDVVGPHPQGVRVAAEPPPPCQRGVGDMARGTPGDDTGSRGRISNPRLVGGLALRAPVSGSALSAEAEERRGPLCRDFLGVNRGFWNGAAFGEEIQSKKFEFCPI